MLTHIVNQALSKIMLGHHADLGQKNMFVHKVVLSVFTRTTIALFSHLNLPQKIVIKVTIS
jgi:hypothetical protein